MQKNTLSPARKLVESAIMLAIATVLSLLKLIDLPYGGSVTVASMLPIIIISYRHNVKWGLLTGLAFGIIQQLLGLKTLSWVTTWQSILAVILLDYIIAFAVAGLGGVFRKITSQPKALLLGALLVGILRYLCHVISGATVWAGLSIPTNAALIYSLGYNATYMIPETIVTMIVGYYIGSVLDFRRENVTRLRREENAAFPILKFAAGLVIVCALVAVTVLVFGQIQNAETGEFDITGLKNVNWPLTGIIAAAAGFYAATLLIIETEITRLRSELSAIRSKYDKLAEQSGSPEEKEVKEKN